MHGVLELITKPFQEWRKHHAPQLAAALAYYTIFSISPLIVIALAIAGQFFNSDTVRAQMMAQISGFAGPSTAQFIDTILQNSGHSSGSLIASIISFIVLLVGASGVFNQLQYALDTIWEVPPSTHANFMSNAKNYVRSFLLVLALGFLLLLFLIVSAVVSALITALNVAGQNSVLPQVLNIVILFLLMTVLFALTFRTVPAKEITWGDVWLGAAITSVLFMIGRYAISLYLTFSKSSSVYGPAGSLIVLLIWIYYSAQIFLLGAEFTQVYARKYGSHKQTEQSPQPQSEMVSSGQQQQVPHPE